MDYKDFEKLHCSGALVFHLALEVLMENGRDAIKALSNQELEARTACRLFGFLTEGKIGDTVKAAKDFAELSGEELLAYAGHCGITLEDEPLDRPGICPLCGSKLIYGEDASASRPHAIGWTCEGCGATGKEAYREVFDCHYDVMDSSGELVVERKRKNG